MCDISSCSMLDLGGAAAIGLGASRGSAIRAPYFAALQLRGKSTMLPKQSVGGVLCAPLHQRHLTTRLHRNNWGGIGAGLANRMVLPKRGRVMAARCQSTSGRFRSRRVMTGLLNRSRGRSAPSWRILRWLLDCMPWVRQLAGGWEVRLAARRA